jgi:GNAT superfamily N-acetyltransferase
VRLLLSAPFQAFASVRRDGGTVAIGRVAVAAGWGGLSAVAVHPGHRRAGLAAAITAALAEAAAGQGAARLPFPLHCAWPARRQAPSPADIAALNRR